MVELISQKKGRHSSTNQTSLRNLGLFELYSDKVSNMLPGNLAAWVTTHIGIGRTSFDSAGGSQPAKVPKVFCTSASHVSQYPRFHPCSDKQEAVKQRQGKLRKPVTWLIGSLTWLQMGP